MLGGLVHTVQALLRQYQMGVVSEKKERGHRGHRDYGSIGVFPWKALAALAPAHRPGWRREEEQHGSG